MLKKLLHKITPRFLVSLYHKILSQIAAVIYGKPSEDMIVIGITGTSGKSTTCEMLWHILHSPETPAGMASGIRFFDGHDSQPNNTKMTMIGRFSLQKLLKRMKQNQCRFAIIEVTSQGISQWRHLGINFDVVLITNLWSEHDEAHGGFTQYKEAKGDLFKHLLSKPVKKISGLSIRKTSIVNADDEHASYFENYPADQKLAFGIRSDRADIIRASNVRDLKKGVRFTIDTTTIQLRLFGKHNAYNALAAIAAAHAVAVPINTSAQKLESLTGVPGRFEEIDEGQKFKVIIDYAFEPKAMEKLYDVILQMPHQKIIHVLGTTGGGRDSKRGALLGAFVASKADIVVATDEDPYDDEPMSLIQRVVTGAQNQGKEIDQTLFIREKRLDGIAKAISLATPGDIVLITGKGSEGTMCIANGKKIPWDDRHVAREILRSSL